MTDNVDSVTENSDLDSIINFSIDNIFNYAKNYKINYYNYSHNFIEKFIERYLIILRTQSYVYKYKDDSKHLQIIGQIFKENPNVRLHFGSFIQLITERINCKNILDTLDLSSFNTDDIIIFMENTSIRGSWPVLSYWLNYLQSKSQLDDTIKIKCIENSFRNTDDRIYKNLVNNIINSKFISDINLLNNDNVKETIIRNICCDFIPDKYVLRRLKAFNSIVKLDDSINLLQINQTICHQYRDYS